MKIIFVSRRFFPVISGMSTYADNLLREYVKLGHQVRVVAQYRSPSAYNPYRDGPPAPFPGVEVVGLEQRGEVDGGNYERDIAELVETVVSLDRGWGADVVHAQFAYPPGLAALLAGRRLRRPVVISIQGGDGHWFGLCCRHHAEVMQLVLARADAVIVGTRSFEDEIRTNHGLPRPLVILPGAVDTTAFHPPTADERRAARAAFGLDADATIVLYHGRIDWRKGVGDLLDAFARLRRDAPPSLQLVVSGVGPDEERMQQTIKALGLGEQCRYLGYVPYAEAPRVYAVGDLFCTPTYGEGFSNTIVEAMASSLPVVSTRVTGVEDVIENGVTGLMVAAQAPEELAAAMRRLLDDASLRQALARNGRELVTQRYAWSGLARRLTALYDDVLTKPRDETWTFELPTGVSVDACRFRGAPHLL